MGNDGGSHNDINWDDFFRLYGTIVDGAVTGGSNSGTGSALSNARPTGSGYNHPRSNSWLTGILAGGSDSNAHTQEYRQGRDNIGDPVHRGPFTGADQAKATWQSVGDKSGGDAPRVTRSKGAVLPKIGGSTAPQRPNPTTMRGRKSPQPISGTDVWDRDPDKAADNPNDRSMWVGLALVESPVVIRRVNGVWYAVSTPRVEEEVNSTDHTSQGWDEFFVRNGTVYGWEREGEELYGGQLSVGGRPPGYALGDVTHGIDGNPHRREDQEEQEKQDLSVISKEVMDELVAAGDATLVTAEYEGYKATYAFIRGQIATLVYRYNFGYTHEGNPEDPYSKDRIVPANYTLIDVVSFASLSLTWDGAYAQYADWLVGKEKQGQLEVYSASLEAVLHLVPFGQTADLMTERPPGMSDAEYAARLGLSIASDAAMLAGVGAGFKWAKEGAVVAGKWATKLAVTEMAVGIAAEAGEAGLNLAQNNAVGAGVSGGTAILHLVLALRGFKAGKGKLGGAKEAPDARDVFRSDSSDPIKDISGPARVSHPEEYAETMERLRNSGVEIQFRKGSNAYSPRQGGPGRMILDPDASIGALRHETRHFDDIAKDGFKGISHHYQNPDQFWRLEFQGYMEEIAIARSYREFEIGSRIVDAMRARRRELLGE